MLGKALLDRPVVTLQRCVKYNYGSIANTHLLLTIIKSVTAIVPLPQARPGLGKQP